MDQENKEKLDPKIEKSWAKEARRRLEEYEAGKVEAIPGEQVMRELQKITEG